MNYANVRDRITTGSLVGRIDENGNGWVAVALRGEDLFTYHGRQIAARPEMAGRLLVVYSPTARTFCWPPVQALSRVLQTGAASVRIVAGAPSLEAVDGLLLALGRYFRVPSGRVPGPLVAELIEPARGAFEPSDGGKLAGFIWQAMGYMRPPPHGPRAEQLTARHLLDPLWGPPQVKRDLRLEDPVGIKL